MCYNIALHTSDGSKENNHYNNRIANTIYGCRRISDFHTALNQTAFKWVQLLLEVLCPKDPFAMSYSDPETKHTVLNRAREEFKHEMNQPDHRHHSNMLIVWRFSTKPKLQFQVLSHALLPSLPPANSPSEALSSPLLKVLPPLPPSLP